jgi:GcrA cell cycle regulator
MLKRTFEGWTEENVIILRELIKDGASATEAGIRLGCSRNAAMGKACRLGLVFSSEVRGRPVTRGHAQPKASKKQQKPKPEKVAIREIIAVEVAPEPKYLRLVQLTDRTCKWPVGDPMEESFGFCGNEASFEVSYCPFHSRLAYQPRQSSQNAARRA